VDLYGAPNVEAAMGVAQEEIAHMIDLCADHDPNTLLTVERELTEAGVRERFRSIKPDAAQLDQVAVHAVPEDDVPKL
jgi:hypothetical protein